MSFCWLRSMITFQFLLSLKSPESKGCLHNIACIFFSRRDILPVQKTKSWIITPAHCWRRIYGSIPQLTRLFSSIWYNIYGYTIIYMVYLLENILDRCGIVKRVLFRSQKKKRLECNHESSQAYLIHFIYISIGKLTIQCYIESGYYRTLNKWAQTTGLF